MSGKWVFRILILVILLLLLPFLDGRFGLGEGLLLNTPAGTPIVRSLEEVVQNRSTILVKDNTIMYEDKSMLLETLAEIIAEVPEDHVFILVDEMANNSLFESVEKHLKDSGRVYTIE